MLHELRCALRELGPREVAHLAFAHTLNASMMTSCVLRIICLIHSRNDSGQPVYKVARHIGHATQDVQGERRRSAYSGVGARVSVTGVFPHGRTTVKTWFKLLPTALPALQTSLAQPSASSGTGSSSAHAAFGELKRVAVLCLNCVLKLRRRSVGCYDDCIASRSRGFA